jgi:hypothetical protein
LFGLEEKGEGLQAEEHHANREARGGSIMLWGCFAAGGSCELHKIDGTVRYGKLCGYIEATSQDISEEVKAWSQMGLPNGQ